MKTIRLIGEARKDLGTTATRRLREEGKVPCVLYGANTHVSFAVYSGDFKNLVYTPNTYLVQIEVDGTKYKSILQAIQFHPVNDEITHVDFLQVSDNKPVSLNIPVKITGNSPGVRAGGKLLVKNKKLRVKGLIANIPDSIEINIDNLELGKSIKVSEIKVNNLELLDSPANAVVSVLTTRATKQAEVDAAKK
ncbi:MAG: 50S ribosomal protein L25/general stress protein Ctc [Bacteroidota bacterium]|jgi:large subunit ribosomal protein L25